MDSEVFVALPNGHASVGPRKDGQPGAMVYSAETFVYEYRAATLDPKEAVQLLRGLARIALPVDLAAVMDRATTVPDYIKWRANDTLCQRCKGPLRWLSGGYDFPNRCRRCPSCTIAEEHHQWGELVVPPDEELAARWAIEMAQTVEAMAIEVQALLAAADEAEGGASNA